MSGLAYDVPDSGEMDRSGPSPPGQLGTIRGDFNPNWTPGNHPHDAGGPVDVYPPPRVYPEFALDVPC